MNETDTVVRTTLRIPGNWSHPGELVERLPEGFRLTPEALILPGGTEVEFFPMPPDDQFADIFKSSCRQPATADELEIVDSYTVNVGLAGPGGSRKAALTMMQAGGGIVRAGGAGGQFHFSGFSFRGGFRFLLLNRGACGWRRPRICMTCQAKIATKIDKHALAP